MSKNIPSKDFPNANWLTVLGISSPKAAEWGEVRAVQLRAFHRFGVTRSAIQLAVIGILLMTFNDSVPHIRLYLWAGVMLIFSFIWEISAQSNQKLLYSTVPLHNIHRETCAALTSGAIWATLPFVIASQCTLDQIFPVWIVYTSVMTCATFTQSSVPLATSFLILLMGGSLCDMMMRLHHVLGAGVAAAYTLGMMITALGNGRNFINHKYAELALTEKNEVVSMLLREYEDTGGDWMWQTDATKCLTHVSPRFAELLGVQPDALEAKPLLQILAGESWEAGNFSAGLRKLSENFKNRESFSDLILPVTIQDEVFWWELSASPRFDERGVFLGFRGVGSDVSDAHRLADKINRMARFDTLTGLPNRLQINETIAQAMNEAKRWNGRIGFMMLDLDRFKSVNDTLGHPVGDKLLTQVAERLNEIMTDNELCGRLGGDEFAVVLKDARDSVYLQQLAQRIVDRLSKPYEVDQYTLFIGASIGTAVSPRDGRTVEMLVRSADLALYRSKDAGGNRVFAFEPQLHAEAEERRVIELALRHALERNELYLHYQPVVNARTGAVESFEALLRWKNPELGIVSPVKFIPIAEDARLIASIGEWVLRTACQEAAKWPDHIRIAVNVSAEQLTNAQFASSVISALSQSGLHPERLELEVTESIFMKEGTIAVQVLEKIIALGVRLALDDFGTGYSSLGYLSKTKFSTIKVDRSFVQGASRKLPECIAIIRAVVALAESLGMSTTAEGVETDEECKMINSLGCRKIQGYLFGRPMAGDEARSLLRNEAARNSVQSAKSAAAKAA